MATSELSAIGTAVARCPSFELAGAAFQRFDQAAVHWRDTEDASKSSPRAIHLRAPVGEGYHWRGFALRRLLGFAIRGLGAYSWLMPSKPIELPPEVAQAFVRDMRAFLRRRPQHHQGRCDSGATASRSQAALQRKAEAARRERDVSPDEGSGVTAPLRRGFFVVPVQLGRPRTSTEHRRRHWANFGRMCSCFDAQNRHEAQIGTRGDFAENPIK